MDFSKLDAALAAALARHLPGSFEVFDVYLRFTEPLSREAADALCTWGLSDAEGQKMVSVRLPRRTIEALSEMPWVASIRLSGKSRLL
jgi:hypothetical protein